MDRRWYVLYTKPNAEYMAARALMQQGFETFLPVVKTPQPRRGYETVPLFPSYVFIYVDLNRALIRRIHESPGVRTIVKFDNKPAQVPEAIIAYIRQRVEEINGRGGLPNHNFQPGDRVYIRSGPLAGLEAIFTGPLGPAERVQVLIYILGALNRAEVPVECLEPLAGPGGMALPPVKRRLPRRTRGRGRRIRNAPAWSPQSSSSG